MSTTSSSTVTGYEAMLAATVTVHATLATALAEVEARSESAYQQGGTGEYEVRTVGLVVLVAPLGVVTCGVLEAAFEAGCDCTALLG